MKKITMKLSEKAINEMLDLQEELGLENKSTREERRKFFSAPRECLFG